MYWNDQSLSLDRLALKRVDPDWLQRCLDSTACLILLNWKQCYPLNPQGHIELMSRHEAEQISAQPLEYHFLGEIATDKGKRPVFTAEIKTTNGELPHWKGLRHTATDDPHTELAFYAQGLLNWHREHTFCSRCGQRLENQDGGNKKVCIDFSCGLEVFPRINPAIIVLPIHGDECLLAHAKRWGGDIPMHSCLAGYVETGENFEQTLHREVYEEVGLKLDEVVYKCNQPWPFPQSLMIGFHAKTTAKDVHFHDDEIASADWFTSQSLVQALTSNKLILPSPKSIAYQLIEDWFNAYEQDSLTTIINSLSSQ